MRPVVSQQWSKSLHCRCRDCCASAALSHSGHISVGLEVLIKSETGCANMFWQINKLIRQAEVIGAENMDKSRNGPCWLIGYRKGPSTSHTLVPEDSANVAQHCPRAPGLRVCLPTLHWLRVDHFSNQGRCGAKSVNATRTRGVPHCKRNPHSKVCTVHHINQAVRF